VYLNIFLDFHAAGRIKITPSKHVYSSNLIPYDHSPLLKYGVLPSSEYDIYGPGTDTYPHHFEFISIRNSIVTLI
jgi:hypothetical protein